MNEIFLIKSAFKIQFFETESDQIQTYESLQNIISFCRYGSHFDFYCFKRHYGMLREANWYVFALNPWLVENIIVVRANELQGQTGAIDPCHVAAILDLKQA